MVDIGPIKLRKSHIPRLAPNFGCLQWWPPRRLHNSRIRRTGQVWSHCWEHHQPPVNPAAAFPCEIPIGEWLEATRFVGDPHRHVWFRCKKIQAISLMVEAFVTEQLPQSQHILNSRMCCLPRDVERLGRINFLLCVSKKWWTAILGGSIVPVFFSGRSHTMCKAEGFNGKKGSFSERARHSQKLWKHSATVSISNVFCFRAMFVTVPRF